MHPIGNYFKTGQLLEYVDETKGLAPGECATSQAVDR